MVANQNQSKMFKKLKMPQSIAKLAYEPVIHPRGLDSNLSIHTHFFLILFVLHLNSNL
jgi:hypothetical protein